MTTQTTRNAEHDLQPIPDWPAQRARSSVPMKEAPMTHGIDWPALYAALSKPFESSLIRYRAGATNHDKTKAQALPYVDPRAYEDRLNTLVPGDWHVSFEPWGNDRIICRLTILGVTRSSTGEAGDSPDGIAGTSAESQSFKRACVKFGLGRHLYAMKPRWMPFDTHAGRLSEMVRDGAPTIGFEKAERLRQSLLDMGVPETEQVRFAVRAVRRPLDELAALTVEEARIVWTEAGRATPVPHGATWLELTRPGRGSM